MQKTPEKWFIVGCGHSGCLPKTQECVRALVSDRTALVTMLLLPQGAAGDPVRILQLSNEYDSDWYQHILLISSQHCPAHVGTLERIQLLHSLQANLRAASLVGAEATVDMFDVRDEPRGLLGFSRVPEPDQRS